MDIAGAIGMTTIPLIILTGVIFVLFLVYAEDSTKQSGYERDRERVLARIYGTAAVGLFVLTIAMWIVAIWLGYAQGAPA